MIVVRYFFKVIVRDADAYTICTARRNPQSAREQHLEFSDQISSKYAFSTFPLAAPSHFLKFSYKQRLFINCFEILRSSTIDYSKHCRQFYTNRFVTMQLYFLTQSTLTHSIQKFRNQNLSAETVSHE